MGVDTEVDTAADGGGTEMVGTDVDELVLFAGFVVGTDVAMEVDIATPTAAAAAAGPEEAAGPLERRAQKLELASIERVL